MLGRREAVEAAGEFPLIDKNDTEKYLNFRCGDDNMKQKRFHRDSTAIHEIFQSVSDERF